MGNHRLYPEADALQRPLVPRSGHWARLTASVRPRNESPRGSCLCDWDSVCEGSIWKDDNKGGIVWRIFSSVTTAKVKL